MTKHPTYMYKTLCILGVFNNRCSFACGIGSCILVSHSPSKEGLTVSELTAPQQRWREAPPKTPTQVEAPWAPLALSPWQWEEAWVGPGEEKHSYCDSNIKNFSVGTCIHYCRSQYKFEELIS